MKLNKLSLLLLLIATCSWGQVKNTSSSNEKQRIPIKPIVVEGEVTGVPDGTPVHFGFQINNSNEYMDGNILVDTIRNGKFRIEKKFIFKDLEDSEDNENYILGITNFGMPIGMPIYAYPGLTVKVTGTPDRDCLNWRAESDHPLQKEFNIYQDYKKKMLASIRKKIQEAYEADNVDDELVEKLKREKDSIYVVSLLDFMKDRECNSVFAMEIYGMAYYATMTLGSEELSDRIRKFFSEKVTKEYNDNPQIIHAKRLLVPSSKHLHVGDKMMDFTFYDRDDKVHKLSEFVGKKPVVLQFSTKGCGPCHTIRPEIEEFYAKHKNEVEIITISMDNVRAWKSEEKVSWQDWNDHASDSSIGTKFDLSGYPYYVIINSDGIISSTFPGNVELREYFKTYQQPQAQQSTTGNQAQLYSPTKDFTLYDRKGKEHKLSEFKGKYIVLIFSYIGEPTLLEAKQVLDGFYKRNKDKVEVIDISRDSKEDWLAQKSTVSFHEWNERASDIGLYYGLDTSFVIIHPNGNILHMSRARLGSFFKELVEHVPDEEIKNLLKQKSGK